MKLRIYISLLFICTCLLVQAQEAKLRIHLNDSLSGTGISGTVYLNGKTYTVESPETLIKGLDPGAYQLFFLAQGFQTIHLQLTLESGMNELSLTPIPLEHSMAAIEVKAKLPVEHKLPNIEGTNIFATKKSELFVPDFKTSNIATNNARQIYQSIAGLNIWENDASGIQLNIGSRGLDPSRTSNFNTRQNGYDISADALGYPEAYYTPPAAAIERIEFVRGAASLQYGPQFGGLLNFKLRESENKKVQARQSFTYGSYNYFQSFTGIGGHHKSTDYYGFYQNKSGQGYRPNSAFDQNTLYLSLKQTIRNHSSIALQYTHMDYLAQQPGGLTDAEFYENPYQSKRSRNWFAVNWNLYAVDFNREFGSTLKINGKVFALDAGRKSAGDLSRPNRPDADRERDLIVSRFRNIGSEWKLLKNYFIGKSYANFLSGIRLYKGFNHTQQGFTGNESGADFNFLNPDHVGVSDYRFPGYNISFFTENVIYLNEKLIINPGFRYEMIETNISGFYKNRLVSGGRVIFEDTIYQEISNFRHFPLFGLGVSYKLFPQTELLANFTQNYRSINFSDMAISNPNLKVDPELEDESGFNLDLGFRGKALNNALWYNTSFYYLNYNNRIGLGEIQYEQNGVTQLTAYRTNIGNAYTTGFEMFAEYDVLKLIKPKEGKYKLKTFINYSFTHGKYRTGLSNVVGKQLEFVIPHVLKTGFNASYGNLFFSYQFSFQDKQFTDATNAVLVSDATRGIIPSFSVHDLNMGYEYKDLSLKLSINNLFNKAYYTRRALSYPGPGIISAEPRTYYLSLNYRIGSRK